MSFEGWDEGIGSANGSTVEPEPDAQKDSAQEGVGQKDDTQKDSVQNGDAQKDGAPKDGDSYDRSDTPDRAEAMLKDFEQELARHADCGASISGTEVRRLAKKFAAILEEIEA